MTTPVNTERYKTHRLPGEIICHGVWLSSRFPLSYRDVQELLCEHGIAVSHAALRQWCRKFGEDYTHQLRRQHPRPGDKGHLDEVSLTMNGQRQRWGQAVNQDDNVLDILVQSRRNKQAVKKIFRKVLKGLQYGPRVVITDELKNYGAAKREILPGRDAHPPDRRNGFCCRMAPMARHVRTRWHRLSASTSCPEMWQRCACWAEMTGTERAAEEPEWTRGASPLCLVAILASIS